MQNYSLVIFFWSSGIIDIMLFTFEFRSCAKGVSVVLHLLLPLMNSFNKTDAAVLPIFSD